MDTLVCRRCHEVKSDDDFQRDTQKIERRGRCYYCKSCCRIRRLKKDYKERSKNSRLLRDFGIDLIQYSQMFEDQQGLCCICGNPPGDKMFAVDHCHTTGKIRGLLCSECNLGLGNFKDVISNLENAIKYLTLHSI